MNNKFELLKYKLLSDNVFGFSGGIAVAFIGEKYTIIDDKGKIIIDEKFDCALKHQNDSSVINYQGDWGVVKRDLSLKIFPDFTEINSFFSGISLAFIEKDKPFVYIDINGKVISDYFEYAYDFSGNLAWCSNDGDKYQCINTNMEIVIPPQKIEPEPFSEGYSIFEKDLSYGAYDKTGNIALFPVFDFLGSFSEDLAVVENDLLNGYINKKNQIVIKPQFEEAYPFHEGLAMVVPEDDEKCAFINKQGEIVIPANFDEPSYKYPHFSEGLCAVIYNGKMGYIDKTGNWVIEPKYDLAENFSEGFAHVAIKKMEGLIRKKERWYCGYIDKTGKPLYPFEP